MKLDAVPRAGVGEAACEFMNVAGRVGGCEEPAEKIAMQRRLDPLQLRGRHRIAIEAAFAQQRIHLVRPIEFLAGLVDVQNAAPLQIEVDPFALGNRKQMLARRNREPDGLDRVRAVMRNLPQKLA